MDSIVDIFDYTEIEEQKQSLLKKCIEFRQKIYKDISKDHFTQDEQLQIEPYLKIHSQLTEKNLMTEIGAFYSFGVMFSGFMACGFCLDSIHDRKNRLLYRWPFSKKNATSFVSFGKYCAYASFVTLFTALLNTTGLHQKKRLGSSLFQI